MSPGCSENWAGVRWCAPRLWWAAVLPLVMACEAPRKQHAAVDKWDQARADATLAVAEEQIAAGQLAQARQTLAAVRQPHDPRLEFAQARLDLEQGEYAAVLTRLMPLAETAGDKSEYHRLLAVAQEARGEWDTARSEYARAYELGPTVDLLSAWVVALALTERLDEARAALDRERGRYPGHPALAMLAGELAQRAGDRDGAVREYNAAARAEPDSREIRQRLAQAHSAAGHVQEALDAWRSLVASSPDSAERSRYQPYLAAALAAAGHYDEARQLYQALLTSQPGNPDLRLALAASTLADGEPQAALATALEVVARSPDNVSARLLAAICYSRLSQPEAAARQLAGLRVGGDLAQPADEFRRRLSAGPIKNPG